MAKSKMSIDARFEYLRRMQKLYRKANKPERSRLLDTMEDVTGLGRKYLIGQMGKPDLMRRARRRERGRVYDAEVAGAIKTIATTLDWVCAERLQPVLREMADCLIAWEEMEASPVVLDKLERISVSSVERILHEIRPAHQRPRVYRGRRSETLAQRQIPVSVIPWDESEPGHFEVDLVHHGVPDENGNLIYTIQFICVLTGWSERFAIMGHEADTMWKAIQTFKEHCPIPVREIHSDNGSEFINWPLIAAFGEEMVDTIQTRGRPGQSNDARFVEQKNSSLVRAYLGTLHLHTKEQRDQLNALYELMWLYYNFFQPVLRQVDRSVARGADGIVRVRRKQDRARTPLVRLLEATPPISREMQERLLALREQTNPADLNRCIHHHLGVLHAAATAP